MHESDKCKKNHTESEITVRQTAESTVCPQGGATTQLCAWPPSWMSTQACWFFRGF